MTKYPKKSLAIMAKKLDCYVDFRVVCVRKGWKLIEGMERAILLFLRKYTSSK